MTDLHQRFRELDRLDVPDMRTDIERRAATEPMAPPKPVTATVPPWRGPLVAVGTAVATLVVIGAAVLLLRAGPAEVTDTLASTAPTTTAPSETTDEASPMAVPDLSGGEWQQVAEDEPWVPSIIDLDPLPDGGFVAVTAEPSPWSVAWSPDGVDWYEGDPHGTLSELRSGIDPDPDQMLIVNGRVVVLSEDNPTIWSGDPQTGEWQSIPLDTAGMRGDLNPRAMAANDSEVLVVGQDRAAGAVVAWLVDPTSGASRPAAKPTVESGLADHSSPEITAAWVNGQWVINTALAAGDGYIDSYGSETSSRSVLWASTHAASWIEMPLPEDPAGILAEGRTGLFIWSGPMAADLWYTPDLVIWEHLVDEGEPFAPTPADDGYLGIQDVNPSGSGELWISVSASGEVWQPTVPLPAGLWSNDLEAYSDGKLLAGLFRLRPGPGARTELWLYDTGS